MNVCPMRLWLVSFGVLAFVHMGCDWSGLCSNDRARSSAPATASLTVGPWVISPPSFVPLPSPPTASSTPGDHGAVVVASNSGFLAAWLHPEGSGSDYTVELARLDMTGQPTDVPPIELTAADAVKAVAVGSDGTDFFTAWVEVDGVRGAVIDADGTIGTPFDVGPLSAENPLFGANVAMAFDGESYLVVWTDQRSIHGAYVDAAAGDSAPFLIVDSGMETSLGSVVSASVVHNGTSFLVVWSQHGDVYRTRVNANGDLLDDAETPFMTSARNPAVATNGDGYLVVAEDGAAGLPARIVAQRVDAAGAAVGAEIPLPANASTSSHRPAVAFTGSGYFVVFNHVTNAGAQQVLNVPVTTTGTAGSPRRLSVLSNGDLPVAPPSVSVSGTRRVAVHERWAVSLSASGTASGERALSQILSPQWAPLVASSGGDYLVAWNEFEGSTSQSRTSRAARVGTTGDVPSAERVTGAFPSGGNRSLSSDGETYALSGHLDSLTAPTASIIEGLVASGISIRDGWFVSNGGGDGYLFVSWRNTGNQYTYVATITARTVSSDGSSISAPTTLCSAIVYGEDPSGCHFKSVTADGTGYAVLYLAEGDPVVLKLDANGAVIDTQILDVDASPNDAAIASNGTGYLVFSRDSVTRLSIDDLTEVDTNPTPFGFPWTNSEGWLLPNVVVSGGQYYVLYKNTTDDVMLARLDDDGVIAEEHALLNVAATTSVGFASASEDAFLIAQAGSSSDPSSRVQLRFVERGRTTDAVCVEDWHCLSESCVAGFCAESIGDAAVPRDSGPVDGGPIEGGPVDGGLGDSGGQDATTVVDGGCFGNDCGPEDSGTDDSAVPNPDGGMDPGEDGGCECSVAGRQRNRPPFVLAFVALALIVSVRRVLQRTTRKGRA